MSTLKYVRLKPYDPLKGHVMIDHWAPWGTRYVQGEWHVLDTADPNNALAVKHLSKVHQHVNNPSTPLSFNICTYQQAMDLIEQEKRQKVERVAEDPAQARMPVPTAVTSTPSHALNRAAPVHELELKPQAGGGLPTVGVTSEPVDLDDAVPVTRASPAKAPAKRRGAKKKANAKKKAPAKRRGRPPGSAGE